MLKQKRDAARVSRLLALLRAHGISKKSPALTAIFSVHGADRS